MEKGIRDLKNKVIDGDYCIGCGICASLDNSPFSMTLDKDGKYRPVLKSKFYTKNIKINPSMVCPFSDNTPNENEIGSMLFSEYSKGNNDYSGYYVGQYAGYVKEGKYREKGSSGGIGTWIATKLLDDNLVDGIIHVKESNSAEKKPLFQYAVSKDTTSLQKGAKSKYYPIELSEVIKEIKKAEGKYALIGIPCFIKSVRLLSNQDHIIKEKIPYLIGLVCGHLKSEFFADSIGWQLGIAPDNLTKIDFRKKLNDRGANDYGVEVSTIENGSEISKVSPTKSLFTTNWGHGFFKYNACEFCDDVLAETADITVGDAWLPQYKEDSLGTNIIIIRNPVIQEVFEKYEEELFLDNLSSDEIYQSQAGGFRHRRQGLAYRLYKKDKKRIWRPRKRVKADNSLSKKRKNTYDMRTILSKESFIAYKSARNKNDFAYFTKYMNPLISKYNKISSVSELRKFIGRLRKRVIKLFK